MKLVLTSNWGKGREGGGGGGGGMCVLGKEVRVHFMHEVLGKCVWGSEGGKS